MAQRRRPQLGEIVSARNSPWRCRSECDGKRGADDERRADGEDLGSEHIVGSTGSLQVRGVGECGGEQGGAAVRAGGEARLGHRSRVRSRARGRAWATSRSSNPSPRAPRSAGSLLRPRPDRRIGGLRIGDREIRTGELSLACPLSLSPLSLSVLPLLAASASRGFVARENFFN